LQPLLDEKWALVLLVLLSPHLGNDDGSCCWMLTCESPVTSIASNGVVEMSEKSWMQRTKASVPVRRKRRFRVHTLEVRRGEFFLDRLMYCQFTVSRRHNR
jgi:hypothetical protein